jgi:hypothetical protein
MISERELAGPVVARRAEITQIDAILRDLKQTCGGDRFHPDYRRIAEDLIDRRRELSRQQPAGTRALRRFKEGR